MLVLVFLGLYTSLVCSGRDISYFQSWESNETWQYHGHEAEVATGQVHSGGLNRSFWLARSIVTGEEVEDVLSECRTSEAAFGQDVDSIDGLPLFEMKLMMKAEAIQEGSSLVSRVLRPLATDRLEPFVRQQLNDCPQCFMCHANIRRYRMFERMAVMPHMDIDAFATVVVALNPEEYLGGLYLTFPDDKRRADQREYFSLKAGDIILHRWDLNHGVRIYTGTRYSLFMWFTKDEASCAGKPFAWFEKAAEDGDAEAAFSLAIRYTGSQWAVGGKDAKKALKYSKQAIKGSVNGMYVYGLLHEMGDLVEKDIGKARRWFKKAATHGHVIAQYKLGLQCLMGDGGPQEIEEGLQWLRRAAELDHMEALMKLAQLEMGQGGVLPANPEKARDLVRRAAELGHKAALQLQLHKPATQRKEL
mmetsp:Transcript_81637/g.144166  ORF Transcript_81637/g.144166 Transcript_81637/m.144166 type:complete len:418 (-) Transcript_81637:266-1519(-)